MFYRRKLPHWHPDLEEGTHLFVTWRLAGSLPKILLPPTLSAGRAFVAQDRELDKAMSGPTWLSDCRVASAIKDALHRGETEMHLYQLQAWVIMPNHVHMLILPNAPLSKIMRWLKGSTARAANLILGRTGQRFWQEESFDHRVQSELDMERIVRYIENNPVSAGFVRAPEAWLWSSARLTSENACPT